MNHMQPYFATCHVLAHLEDPVTSAEFMAKMGTNPFFQADCVGPSLFLKNLATLGLLTFCAPYYQLSVEGKAFEQHILQWNVHDPRVKAARETRQQQEAQTPALKKERVSSVCPACGQKYCALYVFILLYSRFLEGQRHAGGQDDIFQSIRQSGFSPNAYLQALGLPFHHFYYWDQRLSLADCEPDEVRFLLSHLPALMQRRLKADLEHRLAIDLGTDLGIDSGTADTRPQKLPYFQGVYRVLPSSLLQQTQALRHPVLAPYLDPGAPEQLGLLHLGPILYDPDDTNPKRCWGIIRCNAQLQIHRFDYRVKPSFKLVSAKKACYTEQQECE